MTSSADEVRVPEGCLRDEATLAASLKPFGWTCTKDFWRRYYGDPWIFNLANAVERLTEENARLRELIDGPVKLLDTPMLDTYDPELNDGPEVAR